MKSNAFEIYKNKDGKLVREHGGIEDCDGAIWIDVCRPDKKSLQEIREKYSIQIADEHLFKTGENIQRFLLTGQLNVLTPRFVYKRNEDLYDTTRMIFLLEADVLISFRTEMPDGLSRFQEEVDNGDVLASDSPRDLFYRILARVLMDYFFKNEHIGDVLDQIAYEVFQENLEGQNGELHKSQIDRIARVENLNSKIVDSLMGLSFLGDYYQTLDRDKTSTAVTLLEENVQSLMNNADFLSDRVDFVLNAVMGVINLEQNRVVNVFSVFTVVFTLPTVLAGIWGMNFVNMPDTQLKWGYFAALIMIFLSGYLPYRLVKKVGWL